MIIILVELIINSQFFIKFQVVIKFQKKKEKEIKIVSCYRISTRQLINNFKIP